jgi:coproporphyrinogen III oxidase-like Fe-S oxidoreductase
LRRLGRLHNAVEARQAYDISRKIFDRVSFDLIYARQAQTLDQWVTELRQALSLEPDHLSLYQLTIEDGTVFSERFAKGQLRGLPDEGLSVEMYEVTQDLCSAAGLPAYEISNHARPGQESLHNMMYWRGGDYVGIGPGAHGRLTRNGTRYATVGARAPGQWLALQQANGSGEVICEALTPDEVADEYLMMGLRLVSGISQAHYAALGGQMNVARVQILTELGKISVDGDRLYATAEGRLVLNEVIRQLLA